MKILKSLNKKNLFEIMSSLIYFFNLKSRSRFNISYKKYKDLYIEYKKNNIDYFKFVMPIWQDLEKKIEFDFLNNFKVSFLKEHVIKRTMFIEYNEALQKSQLSYIKKEIKNSDLKYILQESPIGNPTITNFKYNTSQNTIHHLNHLIKFSQETKVNLENVNSIVEWGGGYGNLARIYNKINSNITYNVIDLPIFSFIQAAYLSAIFGDDKINLITTGSGHIEDGKINIIPLNEGVIRKLSIRNSDIFISTWALSESNEYSQNFVEQLNYFGSKFILIGHQKKSKDIIYPENIVNHLSGFEIVYHEKIPYLKENYYLFAKRL